MRRRRNRNGRKRSFVNHDDNPTDMLAWARRIRPNDTLHSAAWDTALQVGVGQKDTTQRYAVQGCQCAHPL